MVLPISLVAEKLAHLEAYDQAIQTQQGGAYLRANGLYSSQIAQWRKQSDAGMFDDKQPGQSVGKPTKEQAEIARLKLLTDVESREGKNVLLCLLNDENTAKAPPTSRIT